MNKLTNGFHEGDTGCTKCGNKTSGTPFCTGCSPEQGGAETSPERATRPMVLSYSDPLNFKEGDLFAERYRIGAEIARGGMGRVFRALDQELGVEIALKVIRSEFLDDDRMVRRFKNEILLAREVSHENVVRIFDFSEWQGIKFITMQYIDGTTLRSYMNQTPKLPIDEVCSLAVQICRGLEAARRQGIAHRDLKPQNILLDMKGQAYIADFGLARSIGQTGLSVSGVILGTAEYISPEQWRGQRGDFRSDIYSLGIILWEMTTGRPLYVSDSEIGFMHKHLCEITAFGHEDRVRIPDYLRRIILRCLEKNPAARYQNAAELEADLMNQRASSIPLRMRLERWTRKALRPVLLLLILAGLLVLGYWASMTTDLEYRNTRLRIVVLPFQNNTGEERLAFWSNALADLLTTDLAQSRYLQLVPQTQLQPFLPVIPGDDGIKTLSEEQLHLLRQQTGAEYLVAGKFGKKEAYFTVDTQVISTENGATLSEFQAQGIGEESVFNIVDSVTFKTKKTLKLPQEVILQDYDKDIRLVTTRSIDALKAFSTGKALFNQGEFKEALSHYDRAIMIDPDFAMAYVAKAQVMGHDGDPRRRFFYEQALARIDRISQLEQIFLKGRYLDSIKSEYQMALNTYEQGLNLYPDDQDMLQAIANIHKKMENWSEARRVYYRLDRLRPGWMLIWANLFAMDLDAGNYSAAAGILERYKSELQRAGRYHLFKFYLCFAQGMIEAAETELKLALADGISPLAIDELLGDLQLIKGECESAGQAYTRAFKDNDDGEGKVMCIARVSNFALHRGCLGEALATVDRLVDEISRSGDPVFLRRLQDHRLEILALSPNVQLQAEALEALKQHRTILSHELELEYRFFELYLQGRLLLSIEKMHELPNLIEEMDQLIPQLGKAKRRFILHLRSEWALALHDFDEAERCYNEALALFPNPSRPEGFSGLLQNVLVSDFKQTLARIETARGRIDKAIHVYEKIIKNNIGRLGNAAAWVMAHADLARLYKREGMPKEARSMANMVVEWWDGGDLAPQVVEEMRGIVIGDG